MSDPTNFLLAILTLLTACIAYKQTAILERLKTMPNLSDLDSAIAGAKAAVDAAAQRVIDAQGNGIPQQAIDNVDAIKAAADAIQPA